MGGPNPEERRPEGDERGGAEEEADARPSSSSAAPDDAGGESKNKVVEEKEASTADDDAPAEPQAHDGDPPPRFKGVTKWFNSQKGTQGALSWSCWRARGEGKRSSLELMLSWKGSSEFFFLFPFRPPVVRLRPLPAEKMWKEIHFFFLLLSPHALAWCTADRLDSPI